MNTFSPILRSHEGNKPWVNSQFDSDEETIKATVKFTNIHVLLKPYLKAVEKEYQEKGYPMMRPLFMHYDVYSEKNYLLGKDLLVCPITKRKAKTNQIEIPSNEWIHLFTGKVYKEGFHKIESPLGTPTVFYKKGSKYEEIFTQISEYIKQSN